MHVAAAEPMLRLLEDPFLAIGLGRCEVIPVGAVEGDQPRFGDPSEGQQDVGNAAGTKPHFAASWNGASQIRHRFPSLGVNRQTSACLMDVFQQFRVGKRISCRLAVEQDPIFWDSPTVDTVLELEGHTPVFLILA